MSYFLVPASLCDNLVLDYYCKQNIVVVLAKQDNCRPHFGTVFLFIFLFTFCRLNDELEGYIHTTTVSSALMIILAPFQK